MSSPRNRGASDARSLDASMSRSGARTRRLQLAFLLLLGVAAAQVLWWLVDQASFASEVFEDRRAGYEADLRTASELIGRGGDATALGVEYPHLLFSPAGGSSDPVVRIDPAAIESLALEQSRHIRQYLFEGAFFLLVLLAAMVVMVRVLRQEEDLRLRQQNFLAAVSHELQSPLASLRLGAETMAMREPAAERQRELVERSLADIDRLDSLVGNLLDSARVDEGRIELERRPIVLADAVRETLDSLPESVRLQMHIEACVPEALTVLADPLVLRSILRNVLENAVKASRAKGSDCEIRIVGRAKGDGVELIVSDNGIGFDPEERERLFEKFYRPGDEMTRRTTGTGLGLWLVERFMTLEGGSVEASSEGPGCGAEFRLWWPSPQRAV